MYVIDEFETQTTEESTEKNNPVSKYIQKILQHSNVRQNRLSGEEGSKYREKTQEEEQDATSAVEDGDCPPSRQFWRALQDGRGRKSHTQRSDEQASDANGTTLLSKRLRCSTYL